MVSLQASKSYSFKTPKSEHISPSTTSVHGLDTPMHIVTISPITPKLQLTSNQPEQSGPQNDQLGPLFEHLHMRIVGIERLIYSTNNQVQLHLTTMENQLDAIQQKLEDSLQLFVPKWGRATQREVCIVKGGVVCLRGESYHMHSHIPLDILPNFGTPSLSVIYLQFSIVFINSWFCLVVLLGLLFWFKTHGFVLLLKHLCYFGLLIFKVVIQYFFEFVPMLLL